ncbi:hypothetical protein [Colwellia sp. E150_009]|jgi:hypothetical protein
MELSRAHFKYIFINQGVVASIFNFLLNGLIAWLVFGSLDLIPSWGDPSVGVDIIVTAFLLPYLITVIVSAIVKKEVIHHKAPKLVIPSIAQTKWLLVSPLKFGIFMGGLGLFFFALPLIWVLNIAGLEFVSSEKFIIFKGGWTAIMALLFTPIVALWATVKFSNK